MTNLEVIKTIRYRIRMTRDECASLSDARRKGEIVKKLLNEIEELTNNQIGYQPSIRGQQ